MAVKHNLGKLSDRIADLDTVTTIRHSFTTPVWVFIDHTDLYLSSSYKEIIPIQGNRLTNKGFYLIINKQGKLINKIRI